MSFWRSVAKVLGWGGSCLGGCRECCGDERPRLGFACRCWGRILWVLLHLAFLSVVCNTNTNIGKNINRFDSSSLFVTIPFFLLVAINFLLFLWLCWSDPGYIPAGNKDPSLNMGGSRESGFLDEPDVESMGLLQRSAGFSSHCLLDDIQRQALLLPDRKMNASPNNSLGRESTEETWQLGSIELQHNPSGRGNPKGQIHVETLAHEWYQGANPGRECKTCGAWQMLRARHCFDCNRCIEKFDHHCHWIGKCIGRGNHHIFWSFLLVQTALVFWTLVLMGIGIAQSGHGDDISAWPDALLMLGAVPLFFLLLFVGAMLLFHTYLLSTNQTTFEVAARWKLDYLKDLPPNENPFDQGCLLNIWDGFCLERGHEYVLPSRDISLPVYGGIMGRRETIVLG